MLLSCYYYEHKFRVITIYILQERKKVETTMITPPGSLFVCLLAYLFTAISGYRGIVYYDTYRVSILKLHKLAVSDLLSAAIPGKDLPLFPKTIQSFYFTFSSSSLTLAVTFFDN